jgi:hypothetical protein
MLFFRPSPLRSLAAGVLLLAGGAVDSQADIISAWNQHALAAARDSAQLSPEVSRSLAMMNTAIYNAVQGIAGNYNLYTQGSYTGPSGTPMSGAYMEAAASAAAYTVLADLYGSMSGTFATLYSDQLTTLPDDQARLDGISFGTLVAQDILNWRFADGASDANNPGIYNPVGSAGYWSPTSVNDAAIPGWGSVSTFAISGTAAFNGTLGMSNTDYMATAAYTADYNAVKTLGSSANPGNVRTTEQTEAALFWEGATGTTTNIGLWNQVAAGIVTSQALTLEESARLYAALNVTLADASIVLMDTKYETDFWSPITAITNGGADGNVDTAPDGAWTPMLNSPDMPSYFAEQAILAAAARGILDDFVNPAAYAFSLGSDTDGDGLPDFTFNFTSLNQAADQAADSVVFGGTNFQKAADDGAAAGALIADAVMSSQFSAVPEPAGALLLVLAGIVSLGRRRR